jgi:glycosyltransferase domain-containing protein
MNTDLAVTIIVPTYNRPRELGRSLRFLKLMGNRNPVIIVDGSTAENQKINLKVVQPYLDFAILLQYEPGFHPGLRIADGLKHAKTKYCAVSADDDFILPAGLAESAKFLEENNDYVGALGKFLCLGYSYKLKGGIYFLDHLKHIYDLKQDHFLQRYFFILMLTNIGCAPLYFVVRRTDLALSIYEKMTPTTKFSTMELISTTIILTMGKIRALPVLYGIRNYSSIATRDALREDPKTYHTQEDLTHLRKLFVPLLMKKEGLTEDRAEFVADHFLDLKTWGNMLTEVSAPNNGLIGKRCWYKAQLIINYISPALGSWITGVDKQIISALKKAFLESKADKD